MKIEIERATNGYIITIPPEYEDYTTPICQDNNL